MKLAYSNLAWESSQDEEVALILSKHGVSAVELAPSKVWEKPLNSSKAQRLECREFWASHGLSIAALQAVLFGQGHLKLFESDSLRDEMLVHLKGMIELASDLGAGVIVFGSPKNRQRGEMGMDEAFSIATNFFRAVGDYAKGHGVKVCIEPNAGVYGCDFVRTSKEGAQLVDEVSSPGFGLHLDWGCMELEQEDISTQLKNLSAKTAHFHFSSEGLKPITNRSREEVKRVVEDLSGGPAYCSVEMLNPDGSVDLIKSILGEISECFVEQQAA